MIALDTKSCNHFWQYLTKLVIKSKLYSKYIFSGVLLIFSHYGFSQNWKVVSSSITFKIKHAFGSTAEGSFKGLTSSIFFDTNQLLKTSMIASLEARTIDTGLGLRDKTLRGVKYFDVEKCPKIEMTCTQAERGAKANEYIGTFEVTMRNKSKSLKIPFTFIQTGNTGLFKASFQINRLDFGIGESSGLLGDTVTIFVTLNTTSI